VAESKPAGSKTRDWVIRGVIFGVLAVVLVLAFLDYQKKTQATETGVAWRELLSAANEDDLPLEKLEGSIQGSPEVAESKGQNVYTWKGQFRSYVITVNYDDRFAAKTVDDIEGP
jgi:hypothetical protein